MPFLSDAELEELMKKAEEKGEEKGKEKGKEEEKDRRADLEKKLANGEFYTPIDDVWDKEPVSEYAGCFKQISRNSDYYQEIDDYKTIVKKVLSTRPSGNPVEEALIEVSENNGSDASEKSKHSRKKSKKKKKKKQNSVNVEAPSASLDHVDELSESGTWNDGSQAGGKSNHSTIDDGEISALESDSVSTAGTSAAGTNVSSGAFFNPDMNGALPSSRAHLVPESDCRYPFAVACQAVCGVSIRDTSQMKRFADGMVNSDTNFLRAPANHGKLLDSSPCWIFVPIVSKDFLLRWKKGQGYEVLAIAGNFDGKRNSISSKAAYQALCAKPYHDLNDNGGDFLKRSKCNPVNLREATDRLEDMVLALADLLIGKKEGTISPFTFLEEAKAKGGEGNELKMLRDTEESIKQNGVYIPRLKEEEKLENMEVYKFLLDKEKTDFVPDPMLLLIKAAINWSWRCDQKLLPACGPVHKEGEEQDVSVTTPIPRVIAVPVTPDSDQKWSNKESTS